MFAVGRAVLVGASVVVGAAVVVGFLVLGARVGFLEGRRVGDREGPTGAFVGTRDGGGLKAGFRVGRGVGAVESAGLEVGRLDTTLALLPTLALIETGAVVCPSTVGAEVCPSTVGAEVPVAYVASEVG